MSVNKVILIGRLGQNPEVRYTPSGAAVANFSVATNESWQDKSGQKQEKTEWHRIVVWGKTAENCSQYLTKGRQVYLEGRLQTRQWQDKDGQTKYTTEVQAQTVQFLGTGTGAGAGERSSQNGSGFDAGMGGMPSGGFGEMPGGPMPGSMSSGSMSSGPMRQNGGASPYPSSQPGISQAGAPPQMGSSFTEDDIPF